jgi:hypothetical protein
MFFVYFIFSQIGIPHLPGLKPFFTLSLSPSLTFRTYHNAFRTIFSSITPALWPVLHPHQKIGPLIPALSLLPHQSQPDPGNLAIPHPVSLISIFPELSPLLTSLYIYSCKITISTLLFLPPFLASSPFHLIHTAAHIQTEQIHTLTF